jgi:hypothetical protein
MAKDSKKKEADTDHQATDTDQETARTSTDQVDQADGQDPAKEKPTVKKPSACSGF